MNSYKNLIFDDMGMGGGLRGQRGHFWLPISTVAGIRSRASDRVSHNKFFKCPLNAVLKNVLTLYQRCPFGQNIIENMKTARN